MPCTLSSASLPSRLPLLVAMPSAAARVLHLLAPIAGIWLLISLACVLLAFLTGACYRISARLKIAMIEAAGPLPAPLHDRRRRQRGRFRLRRTRRQLAPQEGAALESLNHAIDYLTQTYRLNRFAGQPPQTCPPQLTALELLLHKRAEMLVEHPPMPSFASLLRRRFAYLRLSKDRV
jgi:hypothetical protein